MDWFNICGLIFMITLMIPNIIFACKHKDKFENKYKCKAVEISEQIGRFGSFGFMILNVPYLRLGYWFDAGNMVYIIGGGLLVLLYCIGWIVFWKTDSLAKAIIISVLPSILFIFSGILSLNIPLIVFSLIFAPCHIFISVNNTVQ